MGCYIHQCYHSGMFTGAQPGVPDVAPVQTLGAPFPLSTEEWTPSYIPAVQKHGAQANMCFSALHKVYTLLARQPSRSGAYMRAGPCPHPLHLCQALPRSISTIPAAHRRSSPGTATQNAQLVCFREGPEHRAKQSMSCANTASGHTHDHWLRSPAPCAKHMSIQRTCAAGQPDMHLGQLIVSERFQSASKLRPGHLNPDGWCDPLRQWRNRGLMWPRGAAHEACRATRSSLP